MEDEALLPRALAESSALLARCRDDADLQRAFSRFVDLAVASLERGGRILACGNGGSMSGAMHFAEELVGRFREERRAFAALALSDPATLSCIANDFGFESVFARQVEAHGRAGDLLVCLSTSGRSENLVRAASTAREQGLTSVALLGRGGGKLGGAVDVTLLVPEADTPDRIQEVHGVLLHAAIEAIEQRLG